MRKKQRYGPGYKVQGQSRKEVWADRKAVFVTKETHLILLNFANSQNIPLQDATVKLIGIGYATVKGIPIDEMNLNKPLGT